MNEGEGDNNGDGEQGRGGGAPLGLAEHHNTPCLMVTGSFNDADLPTDDDNFVLPVGRERILFSSARSF